MALGRQGARRVSAIPLPALLCSHKQPGSAECSCFHEPIFSSVSEGAAALLPANFPAEVL